MKELKRIPDFGSFEEEARFWNSHDSTEYIDWSKSERTVFSNLKPTTESISLRLPSPLLARLKGLANERDVPYQSLLKMYLSERIDRELGVIK
jgi:predicted DNA binding CopG/RHH family protein